MTGLAGVSSLDFLVGLLSRVGRSRKVAVAFVMAVGVVWLVSCDQVFPPEPPVEPRPTAISLSPTSGELTAFGDTLRLTAEVRDQNGDIITNAVVTWSSTAPAIATVDATGLVTATSNGKAAVTVLAGIVTADAAITVAQRVSSVVVSPAEAMLEVGDTLSLSATAHDGNGHQVMGLAVGWTSSNTRVAEVALTGFGSARVTARAAGSTEITATASGIAGQAQLTVTVTPDRAALEALYNSTDGPNWKNNSNWLTDTSLGLWHGVDVDQSGRVTGIDLSNNALTGSIPPEIAGLTNLRKLSLSDNRMTGPIPPEVGRLANLENLSLSYNSFSGSIPAELGNLSKLMRIDFEGNTLDGVLPPELGNLSDLWLLFLGRNKFTGPIPREFLELDALRHLSFDANLGLCAPGNVAFVDWLGKIGDATGPYCNAADVAALEEFFAVTNGDSWTRSDGWHDSPALDEWYGVDADSIGRVVTLNLVRNGLSGTLPPELGNLAAMSHLRVGNNALTGSLPRSLTRISLSELHYVGTSLCTPADEAFRMWLNGIESHQGTGTECTPLSDREILAVFYGATGGRSWNNSTNWLTDAPLAQWHGVGVDAEGRVSQLALGGNGLSGTIPAELGGLARLDSLFLGYNSLSGPVPPELGQLARLKELWLDDNSLTGSIPPELGNLSELEGLWLFGNALSGEIPPELGKIGSLKYLSLKQNALTSSIPSELGNLVRLDLLDLEDNDLSGAIPTALGNMANLREAQLSNNGLSGELPGDLGRLSRLERLYLGGNQLTGPVPSEFGELANLRELVLAGNAGLSGPLPTTMSKIRRLTRLATGGTGLCAPSDASFQVWLGNITDHWVAVCGGGVNAYLTQAVQSREFPVPLVAGERALLRVFVTAMRQTDAVIPPVRARFFVNGSEREVVNIPAGSRAIPTRVDEGDLALSANVEVSGDLIQPGLELVVEVDPDSTLDPQLGVARRVPTTGRLSVEVRAVPTLNLTVIPFLWEPEPDRAVLNYVEGMAADPQGHELLEDTHRLLPVKDLNLVAHAPVTTSTNDVYQILAQTDAIRMLEAGNGHYMGMISGAVTGGASGVAATPGKVSFSLPDASTIAHELGHNFSLRHAPCGGPNKLDVAFPYPDGTIGAWGYDFRNGGQLVRPRQTWDMMSYCEPEWVSDYNFAKATRYRVNDGADVARLFVDGVNSRFSPTLLVWGGVDKEGVPYLNPAFVAEGAAALPDGGGDYTIVGRTTTGNILFSVNFAMSELADADGAATFAFLLPVAPEWAGQVASISLTGPDGTATLDQESDNPMAIVMDAASGQVTAILRDVESATAAFDGVPDVRLLFSRGVPSEEAWR